MRSGIVLAGGRSTRFGGREKSLELVEGKRMICRAIDSICGAVDEVIISVRDEQQRDILAPFVSSYRFVFDEAEGLGPPSRAYVRPSKRRRGIMPWWSPVICPT